MIYSASPFHGLDVLSCRGGRHFGKHLHDGYVLWLNSESGEKYRLKGAEYVLLPGSISLIEPGVVHANYPCDPQQRHLRSLYFSHDFLMDIAEKCSDGKMSGFAPQTYVLSNFGLWRRLADLHEGVLQLSGRQALESEILLMFADLFALMGKGDLLDSVREKSEKRVETVIEYFKEHLSRNVSLDELAVLVQCSSYHLIRIFRDKKGVSPHAYQVQMRLEHAAKQLREGCSIADAALQAGFSDQSHLSRSFKARYGVTPRQYMCYLDRGMDS